MQEIYIRNKAYYDNLAQSYHDRYHDELTRKPYDRLFLDLFLSLLPPRPTILDVGCGSSAQQSSYLSSFGQVTGIDLSENNIKVASAAYPEIKFFCQNMIQTNFSSSSFDGLCVIYSMIHLPSQDVIIAIKEFHRILRTNGIIAIAVHDGKFEGIMDNDAFDENSKADSVYFKAYEQGELDKILGNSGFAVLHTAFRKQIYEFEYPTSRHYIIAQKI